MGALRLLILAEYRPLEMILSQHPFIGLKQELQKQSLCREVKIALLRREDVASYLDLEYPAGGLAPELADLIFRRTEGNPLFMADLVRHLRDCRMLDGPLDRIERGVPEAVKSVIQRRIDRLARDGLD